MVLFKKLGFALFIACCGILLIGREVIFSRTDRASALLWVGLVLYAAGVLLTLPHLNIKTAEHIPSLRRKDKRDIDEVL